MCFEIIIISEFIHSALGFVIKQHPSLSVSHGSSISPHFWTKINQITPTKSRVFSKEGPCVPPFILYCAWIKHMRPSHWIRLNIKPLEKPGILFFPNARTISINVNKSYVKGWGKPFPLCFITFLFYELVSWMINQRYCKTIILWGKPPWNFPSLCYSAAVKKKNPKN